MKSTNTYLIPFIGLKIGKHHFEYEIEKKFFDVFAFDEFENCTIHIAVVLEKKTTIMELSFAHKGTVVVPCDLTGEMFDLPIKGKIKLVVQFGEKFNKNLDDSLLEISTIVVFLAYNLFSNLPTEANIIDLTNAGLLLISSS